MDFRNTVRLPKTSFSMKARLPEREPILLKKWQQENLYEQIKPSAKALKSRGFVLHDGPPFANGHLHMGHALNKILKDIIMKYKRMSGYAVPYVPGWDCHGLPIEWMIETEVRKKGISKEDIPPSEFRQRCRDFATKWVKIQSEEFQRLGILGDWKNPYITMEAATEANIVQEVFSFLMNDRLYQGFRPVFWSVVEKTALAEAEVEYKEKISPSIYVAFPMRTTPIAALENAWAVIWTTTPWTLPGNRAIAFHPNITYSVLEILSDPYKGQRILIAQALSTHFCQLHSLKTRAVTTLKGKDLYGSFAHHPLWKKGYTFSVPLLPGTHVTTEQGTGLVHTAPGHGQDDFALGKEHHLEIPQTVAEDGIFYPHIPCFAGLHVFKANEPVIDALQDQGMLLSHNTVTHSYPHSWRSKAPLIFRTTSQWFIDLEKDNLRQKALQAITQTQWIPSMGQKRIESMVAGRPDWCLSRQRMWGVPLALFIHKQTQKPLKDARINTRIYEAMTQEGSDIWFEDNAKERFLKPDYDPEDFEICRDIIDVWFESGSTHAFVLEQRADQYAPADLYLEGSDQHRGWFQSSLLQSIGTRDRSPFHSVLTHGFVVDAQGYKMSKSQGNTVSLQDLIKSHGADIIRLWVMSSDFFEDLKIGPAIIKRQEDMYRRIRNTFRFLLANTSKKPLDSLDAELPLLEKWILHRLAVLEKNIGENVEKLNLHRLYTHLYNFCTSDLSAFYFDIRKDTLYCEGEDSPVYHATLFTMHHIFQRLVRWFAPILSFTSEEAWLEKDSAANSIHSCSFLPCPSSWYQPTLEDQWKHILTLRRLVLTALEHTRTQGTIGSSLEAHVHICLPNSDIETLPPCQLIEDVCIVSQATYHPTVPPSIVPFTEEETHYQVWIEKASGEKCERCWKILPDVTEEKIYSNLCHRCHDVVMHIQKGA